MQGVGLEIVSVVLILLVALLASSFLLRASRLPLPLPLAQIVVGTALGSVADLKVELDPEIFFLLFLPPLLFIDGWRIPKQGLFRDASTILELALGLVIFTVIGMGFFMHWLIPAIAAGSVFCAGRRPVPTDPVAVSAHCSTCADPEAHDAHSGRGIVAERRLRSCVPALCHRSRPDRDVFGAGSL